MKILYHYIDDLASCFFNFMRWNRLAGENNDMQL